MRKSFLEGFLDILGEPGNVWERLILVCDGVQGSSNVMGTG